jgi:hypothetical protein
VYCLPEARPLVDRGITHASLKKSKRKLLATLVDPSATPVTTRGAMMGNPHASHTRNCSATVLPALNLLDPSALIGARIACPGAPRHDVPVPL